jgi:hypothetical protein
MVKENPFNTSYPLQPIDRLTKNAISQGPAYPVLPIILKTTNAIKQTAATGRAIFVMVSFGL